MIGFPRKENFRAVLPRIFPSHPELCIQSPVAVANSRNSASTELYCAAAPRPPAAPNFPDGRAAQFRCPLSSDQLFPLEGVVRDVEADERSTQRIECGQQGSQIDHFVRRGLQSCTERLRKRCYLDSNATPPEQQGQVSKVGIPGNDHHNLWFHCRRAVS